jgi:hypothetical protein
METTLIKCLVCNNEFSNVMKLAKHLKYVHHTNLEQYFSRYIQIRPNCVICEKPVTFKSYDIGFSECCDSRKCSAINFRKKLKANTNKYNSFVNKVSTNMINTWKSDQSKRVENITKTKRITISNMSIEERREKYGYIHKLSDSDRKIFIEKMLQTGCHRWWREASEEEKNLVIESRADTLRKTWDIRGDEILAKMMDTHLKNNKPNSYIFSKDDYNKMDTLLSKLFDL